MNTNSIETSGGDLIKEAFYLSNIKRINEKIEDEYLDLGIRSLKLILNMIQSDTINNARIKIIEFKPSKFTEKKFYIKNSSSVVPTDIENTAIILDLKDEKLPINIEYLEFDNNILLYKASFMEVRKTYNRDYQLFYFQREAGGYISVYTSLELDKNILIHSIPDISDVEFYNSLDIPAVYNKFILYKLIEMLSESAEKEVSASVRNNIRAGWNDIENYKNTEYKNNRKFNNLKYI